MGYRSDVGLVMTKELAKKLKGETLINTDASKISKLLEAAEHFETQDEELYHWTEIKWYPGYPEIDFIEKFLADQDDYGDYLFIILGEELADIEERGWRYENDFDFGVIRYLNVDKAYAQEATNEKVQSV